MLYRGSPPRMRGQVTEFVRGFQQGRITPADAGTRAFKLSDQVLEQDHPRGCGDKHQSDSMRFVISGSPPRMRGQVVCSFFFVCVSRITPADAGTSGSYGSETSPEMDHPRGCGDKHRR